MSGITIADAILWLPGWPYKAVSDKRAIDIAVKVQETFSPDLSRIVKATTSVGYFRRQAKEDKCRPELELHYDFDTPTQEAHPVFHAHVATTKWPVEELRKLGGLVGEVERVEAAGAYTNARIPTAFMGFAPLLVSLAADHLKPKNFRRMLEAAQLDDEGTRDPECALLSECLAAARPPRAHYWYDGRYVVHEWRDGGRKHRAAVPVLKQDFEGRDAQSVRNDVRKGLGVTEKQLLYVSGEPPP